MKLHPFVVMPVTAALVVSAASPGITATDAEKNVKKATEVFQALMSNPKTQIPPSVMQTGKAIVIIPDMIQAGFIFGGRRGAGIMAVRQADGTWSNPAFVTLTGGSFGLQFGAQSTDVVLVFNSQDTVNDVLDGNSFKFAGTGTATAGPVGGQGYLPTDARSKAKIYSYVRSREGLFAGVSLEGSELSFDGNRNREFYGQPMITPQQIFTDKALTPPVVVNPLKKSLNDASSAPATGAANADTGAANADFAFQTNSYAVRVYHQGEQTLMNVFNKKDKVTFLRGTPVKVEPNPEGTNYTNTSGEPQVKVFQSRNSNTHSIQVGNNPPEFSI